MNREILFGAIRKDTIEWIEGFYYIHNIHNKFSGENEVLYVSHFIRPICPDGMFEAIEVHPEIVCQFTGLVDKNGNKIFENHYFKIDKNAGVFYKVIFEKGAFGYKIEDRFVSFAENFANLKGKGNQLKAVDLGLPNQHRTNQRRHGQTQGNSR